jgi:hypothetical protein
MRMFGLALYGGRVVDTMALLKKQEALCLELGNLSRILRTATMESSH